METITLFTDQKWNIISALAKGKYSPLQLAEKCNTTIANISQQLRLLEASNLVQKEKIRNRDRGKPRTLFSLANDYGFVVSASNGFAEKKLFVLDGLHNALVRALFLDERLRNHAERLLWNLEDYLKDINLIALESIEANMTIIISAKENQKGIKDAIAQSSKLKQFKIRFVSIAQSRGIIKKDQDGSLVKVVYDSVSDNL